MVVLILTSCFQIFDVGNNTLVKETYNNNASKKAILFFKGENATSDISLQVIIAGYDHELKKQEVGNAFTVDSDHNATKQDSSSIDFIWLTNDTLKIEYDKKLRTFIMETKVQGVNILYKSR